MPDRWLLPVMRDLSGLVVRAATARIDAGSVRNAQAEVAEHNMRHRQRAEPWSGAWPSPERLTGPPRGVGGTR